MGHVRYRPVGLNEADTKAAFIDPVLSALGWELRDAVTGHAAGIRSLVAELASEGAKPEHDPILEAAE
jgi:hypothetical protein